MAVERKTISVDGDLFAEFTRFAESKGIKFSTWIQSKMREFVVKRRSRKRRVGEASRTDKQLDVIIRPAQRLHITYGNGRIPDLVIGEAGRTLLHGNQ